VTVACPCVIGIELERLLELRGGLRVVAAVEVRLTEQGERLGAPGRELGRLGEVRDRVAEQALAQGDLAHAEGRRDALAVELDRLLEVRSRAGGVAADQLLRAEVGEELGLL